MIITNSNHEIFHKMHKIESYKRINPLSLFRNMSIFVYNVSNPSTQLWFYPQLTINVIVRFLVVFDQIQLDWTTRII